MIKCLKTKERKPLRVYRYRTKLRHLRRTKINPIQMHPQISHLKSPLNQNTINRQHHRHHTMIHLRLLRSRYNVYVIGSSYNHIYNHTVLAKCTQKLASCFLVICGVKYSIQFSCRLYFHFIMYGYIPFSLQLSVNFFPYASIRYVSPCFS